MATEASITIRRATAIGRIDAAMVGLSKTAGVTLPPATPTANRYPEAREAMNLERIAGFLEALQPSKQDDDGGAGDVVLSADDKLSVEPALKLGRPGKRHRGK